MADEEEKRELDLGNSDVVTKYKAAAEVANKVLATLIKEAKPGSKVLDLCEKGDSLILEFTSMQFKNAKKKVEKGIAFPTCINVNNTVCHFSPQPGDETALVDGDVVKIDLGVHIDGFIAVVAHTIVVQEAEGPITGRVADIISAAQTAAEVALRLVRPGKKNSEVTEALQKVAAAYNCKVVEGVLSHQMKQFVIDANKVVISASNPEMRVDDFEFEENEVYGVDVVLSSGEGKPKLLDEKLTNVFKRAVDKTYQLKLKSSRSIFNEINHKFSIMPFTARSLEEKRARLGIVECVNHELLQPYPVLHEKPGDIVAQFKFTVLLMPNGSDKITGHPLQPLQPDVALVDPEVKSLLALGIKSKKRSGGKKRKGKKEAGSEREDASTTDANADAAAGAAE